MYRHSIILVHFRFIFHSGEIPMRFCFPCLLKLSFVIALIFTAGTTVFAEQISTIALYGGTLHNQENSSGSEDSGMITGIFAQYIDTGSFQVNDFFYFVPDVNDSSITGNHLVADYYPLTFNVGHSVVGAGYEFIRIDMSNDTMEMLQYVNLPYIRVGQYFNFGQTLKFSLLPWTGAGYMINTGSGSMSFPFPVEIEINQESPYWLNGINLKMGYSHFFDVTFKYGIYYNLDEKEYYNHADVSANLYLQRHYGISYRFKYSENSSGNEYYHILGALFSF